MKKVIITGGAGFVGSAVIKELLMDNIEIWAIVSPGFIKKINGSRLDGIDIHLIECDLKDIIEVSKIIKERNFDTWYHFAWEGLRGDALTDYSTQIKNIIFTLDSIHAAADLGCNRFIGAGSISQYELFIDDNSSGVGDKHRIYKTAKLACEYMGRSVAESYNIKFIWPIITNIYGVGENSPRLINSMIKNLIAGNHQSLSSGNQYYDFIYITDAAKAFKLIGEKGKDNRTYVIASGNVMPLKKYLCELRDVVDPKAELGFGEMPFNGFFLSPDKYSILNLVEDTGFSPDVSFKEGIKKTKDWLLQVENKKYDKKF